MTELAKVCYKPCPSPPECAFDYVYEFMSASKDPTTDVSMFVCYVVHGAQCRLAIGLTSCSSGFWTQALTMDPRLCMLQLLMGVPAGAAVCASDFCWAWNLAMVGQLISKPTLIRCWMMLTDTRARCFHAASNSGQERIRKARSGGCGPVAG